MSIYTWYSDKELLAFCLRKIPAWISANEQHARKILYKKKKKKSHLVKWLILREVCHQLHQRVCTPTFPLYQVTHCHFELSDENKMLCLLWITAICLPTDGLCLSRILPAVCPTTVGQQSTDRWLTDGRQLVDRWLTDGPQGFFCELLFTITCNYGHGCH